MDEQVTAQAAAVLRFRKQIELLADPDEYRHYANGEPMAPDATDIRPLLHRRPGLQKVAA